ncbi:hypothetical protein [Saccharothrix hoggarensis]|uniref:Uncharacterized protein n=1 Tax=Saccharothrix hoggarensis TaxID=913853 RepID=A0ABW3QN40_9PSEU
MTKKPTPAQLREIHLRDQHEARVRSNEDAVLAKARKLDPNDKSEDAEYIREVAGDIQDHRDSEAQRG